MIQVSVALVLVMSLAVLVGWWLGGVAGLTSVLPGAVTMKPVTAVTGALASLGVLARRHRTISSVLLTASAGLVLLAQFDAIPTLLRMEGAGAAFSTAPDVPSIGTTVGFILLAVSSLAGSGSAAVAATAIGASCLAGYALRVPELFFYVRGASTAMAVHTGAMVAVMGMALSKSLPTPRRTEAQLA